MRIVTLNLRLFRFRRAASRRCISYFATCLLTALVMGCGGGGDGGGSVTTYSISASVAGLSGTGLTITFNGQPQSISSNDTLTLQLSVSNGSNYSVAIGIEPTQPDQTCTVANGIGTVNGGNVTIAIVCTTSNTPQSRTMVSIDAAVPQSVTDSIQQFISPSGKAAPGNWLDISMAGTTGQSIVLAVDANDVIQLASIANSYQTALSADSTALALVRLALGDIDTTKTGDAIDTTVRASPAFPALVAAVQSALQRGVAPVSDPTVAAGIVDVAIPVVSPITSAASTARAFVIQRPTAVLPLPITVVADTLLAGLLPVQIINNGVNDVGLSNSMPIPWSVSSVGPSNAPLSTDLEISGRTGLITPGTAMVTADNAGFSLTLAQTDSTHAEIGADLIYGSLKAVLGFASPQTCLGTIDKAALKAALEGAISSGLSWDLYMAALKKFVTPTNFVTIFSKCTNNATLVDALQPIVDLIKVVATVKKALNAVAVFTEGAYAYTYWDVSTPHKLGVCETDNWAVTNCADHYAFNPASISLAPAAVYMPQIQGKLSDNSNTGVPAGLTYKTVASKPFTLDPSSGLITASSSGSVVFGAAGAPFAVGVTDQETSATGSLAVSVVFPQISPASSSTPVGGTLTDIVALKLTDKNQNAVVLPPGAATWTSDDPNNVHLKNASLLNGATSSWYSPPGSLPGVVTISAVGADGTAYGTARVTVTTPKTTTYTIVSGAGNVTSIETWDLKKSTLLVSSPTSATFTGHLIIKSGSFTNTYDLTPFSLSGAVPNMTGASLIFNGDVTLGIAVTAISATAASGTIFYTDNTKQPDQAKVFWNFSATAQ